MRKDYAGIYTCCIGCMDGGGFVCTQCILNIVFSVVHGWRWANYVLCYAECTGGGGQFIFCVMLSARVEVGNLCSVLQVEVGNLCSVLC